MVLPLPFRIVVVGGRLGKFFFFPPFCLLTVGCHKKSTTTFGEALLWSDASNWSPRPPIAGDDVVVANLCFGWLNIDVNTAALASFRAVSDYGNGCDTAVYVGPGITLSSGTINMTESTQLYLSTGSVVQSDLLITGQNAVIMGVGSVNAATAVIGGILAPGTPPLCSSCMTGRDSMDPALIGLLGDLVFSGDVRMAFGSTFFITVNPSAQPVERTFTGLCFFFCFFFFWVRFFRAHC